MRYAYQIPARSGLLHEETVPDERDLFQHAANTFLLAEKVPQNDFFTLCAHQVDRFEKQFFPVAFFYIGLEITHHALLF